MLSKKLKY